MRVDGTEPVEQLLYEWQQTARIWADPELAAELSTDIDAPLMDIEIQLSHPRETD